MSWLDRIENIQLTIITGDGKSYKPLWIGSTKNIKFNTEGFNQVGVEGTFVDRKEMQGRQYPMEIYFQGEDCIEISDNFEQSSRDKKPWQIVHPYYGEVSVQPLELNFDNRKLNTVIITGTLWETNLNKETEIEVSELKDIEERKSDIDDATVEVFTDNIETPDSRLIRPTQDSINSFVSNFTSIIRDSESLQEMRNIANTVRASASALISAPEQFMRDMINLINFPNEFIQDIQFRVDSLLNTFDDLVSIFVDESSETTGSQVMFESQCTVLFSVLSEIVVKTDAEDYLTRANILSTVNKIAVKYENFLQIMDTNSIDQDPDLSQKLDYIVSVSIAYLYTIVFEAKQERIYTLDRNDCAVNLAHRFIGPGDDNLQLFINQNNLHMNEYLLMLKGRRIIYYV